jgi:hypothetical protein
MLAQVIRVPAIAPGVVIYVDEQPGSWVLWVREDVLSEESAALLESALEAGFRQPLGLVDRPQPPPPPRSPSRLRFR